jgi:hypothetical protein
MPLFAVANPWCFFFAYLYCFDETDTPYLYVPNFRRYFALALAVYLLLTLLKYPIYYLKRLVAKKKPDIKLFFLFHTASQIPYLVMLPIYYNYWGPRDLNVLGFHYFLWFFFIGLITWFFAFCIFNFLTYLFPMEQKN